MQVYDFLAGYGMQEPCGHVDFYPNNGREQPGCDLTEIPLNLIHLQGYDEVQREIFACNHHRAIYYFTESLNSNCRYVGHACSDYDTYLKAQCFNCKKSDSDCAIMGLDAEKYMEKVGRQSNLPFYLSTGKIAPFCVHQYRINLQTAFPPQAAPWISGKLKMKIIGTISSMRDIDLSPNRNLRIDHGTNLTFLLQNNRNLGTIQQIQLDWKYDHDYLDFFSQCWTFFCNNRLFVKKIEIQDIDDPGLGKTGYLNAALCGEEGTKYNRIASGAVSIFERPC